MFCFDTDILATVVRRDPPLGVLRRLAVVPPSCQFTTAISYGELVYSAAAQGSEDLPERIRGLLLYSTTVLPFDDDAALRYGRLRASLDSVEQSVAEPDLRIAAIALSRSLILVTGSPRRFEGIDGLEIQNWLDPGSRRSGPEK